MTVTCNDPGHEAWRRMRERNTCERCGMELRQYRYPLTWPGDDAGELYTEKVQRHLHDRRDCAPLLQSRADLDRFYGTPCLICGAPINSAGDGHDEGCMGLDS